ncbi:hypothetical protein Agub_g7676 [Astrephomene gubernaculifera]|uniref:STIL N-terminal domain-containing protein n=1 Tax=Astrephomene gubernaculifera TaxID=47775 RepID=A0AAD3DS33_9CHLO|nr:hypothetical protein Agub_g7676 [Astrephomene gubernaculifera]
MLNGCNRMSKSAFVYSGTPLAHSSNSATAAPRAPVNFPAASSTSTPWQSQSASRTVRFPSSRRFLWDRTAHGRAEVVELKDNLPVVSIPCDFHRRLEQAESAVAIVSCPNGRRLHVSLVPEARNPAGGEGALIVPVALAAGAGSEQQQAQLQERLASLMQTLQHGLDRRGPASLATGWALGVTLSSQSQPPTTAAAAASAAATFVASLLLPAAALTLTPLYGKRLCDVPFAQALMISQQQQGAAAGDVGAAGTGAGELQTGYLSMDQARSLLPLAADDVNVYSMPLVGVWVRGARGPEHPLVYCTALKFAYGTVLPDRVTQPDGSFLVLLFTGDSPMPRCYEARFSDPTAPNQQDLQQTQANTAAATPGGAGIGGGSGGLRLLPYAVCTELAAPPTSAPAAESHALPGSSRGSGKPPQDPAFVELRPVLDSSAAALAASGARGGGCLLMLQPPQASLPAVAPAPPAHLPAAATSLQGGYSQAHGGGHTQSSRIGHGYSRSWAGGQLPSRSHVQEPAQQHDHPLMRQTYAGGASWSAAFTDTAEANLGASVRGMDFGLGLGGRPDPHSAVRQGTLTAANTPGVAAVDASVQRGSSFYGEYGLYSECGNVYDLRGSGSKLMTSPSKAMKVLKAGGGGAAAAGGDAAASGQLGGATATALGARGAGSYPSVSVGHEYAAGANPDGGGGPTVPPGPMYGSATVASAAGAGGRRTMTYDDGGSGRGCGPAGFPPVRDSPPVPRTMVVPTPFRPVPAAAADPARGEAGGSGCGGNDEGTVGAPIMPRDPRLQHRVFTAPSAAPLTATQLPPPSSATAASAADATERNPFSSTSAPASGSTAPGSSTSADWAEAVGGVMHTPAVGLRPAHASRTAATVTPGPHAAYDSYQAQQQQQQPYSFYHHMQEEQQQQHSQHQWHSGSGLTGADDVNGGGSVRGTGAAVSMQAPAPPPAGPAAAAVDPLVQPGNSAATDSAPVGRPPVASSRVRQFPYGIDLSRYGITSRAAIGSIRQQQGLHVSDGAVGTDEGRGPHDLYGVAPASVSSAPSATHTPAAAASAPVAINQSLDAWLRDSASAAAAAAEDTAATTAAKSNVGSSGGGGGDNGRAGAEPAGLQPCSLDANRLHPDQQRQPCEGVCVEESSACVMGSVGGAATAAAAMSGSIGADAIAASFAAGGDEGSGLSWDPAELRREVVRLRKQVACLQQQIASLTASSAPSSASAVIPQPAPQPSDLSPSCWASQHQQHQQRLQPPPLEVSAQHAAPAQYQQSHQPQQARMLPPPHHPQPPIRHHQPMSDVPPCSSRAASILPSAPEHPPLGPARDTASWSNLAAGPGAACADGSAPASGWQQEHAGLVSSAHAADTCSSPPQEQHQQPQPLSQVNHWQQRQTGDAAAAASALQHNDSRPAPAGQALSTGELRTASAAVAVDERAERMSVSGASEDRGSVWSMGSIRSSLMSYQSYKTHGNMAAVTVTGASSAASAFAAGTAGHESTVDHTAKMHAAPPAASAGAGVATMAVAMEPHRTIVHSGSAGVEAMIRVQGPDAESSYGQHTGQQCRNEPQPEEPLQREPTLGGLATAPSRPVHSLRTTAGMVSPAMPTGLTARPDLLRHTIGRSAVSIGRGRRRARRTSSSSSSDTESKGLRSMDSDEDTRTSRSTISCAASSVRLAAAATSAGAPKDAWSAKHGTAYGDSAAASLAGLPSVSEVGSRAWRTASSPPSPSVLIQQSTVRSAAPLASGTLTAMTASVSTGGLGIVRTKYVPLEDDSDSSDSESEMRLMQKYGIRDI